MEIAYLLLNFGGPRSLDEIEPFLKTLLTDGDVIRTGMPKILQNLLFKKVAKKRAIALKKDYELIGGSSPIYTDTEEVAKSLRNKLKAPVVTFHRYLPSTHEESLNQLILLNVKEIRVFPFFPQFTYATTGSLARFFYKKLPKKVLNKLSWIKSYPTHPSYISLFVNEIEKFIKDKCLKEDQTYLLFSAHGVPQTFVEEGDVYQREIEASFEAVMRRLPQLKGKLCYQSRFGPEEWIKPYTIDLCESVSEWREGRKNILFIPISFTSDHIETLFEVEHQYMPVIVKQGLNAYRLPAFNQSEEWIDTIIEVLNDITPVNTAMLVRWC